MHIFVVIFASSYILLAYIIEGENVDLSHPESFLSKEQIRNLDVSALNDDSTNSLNAHLQYSSALAISGPTTEDSQLSNNFDARISPVSNCDSYQTSLQKRSTNSNGRGMCGVNENGFKDPGNQSKDHQYPRTSPPLSSPHQKPDGNPCANNEFQPFYAVCTGGRFGNQLNPDYVLGCFRGRVTSSPR